MAKRTRQGILESFRHCLLHNLFYVLYALVILVFVASLFSHSSASGSGSSGGGCGGCNGCSGCGSSDDDKDGSSDANEDESELHSPVQNQAAPAPICQRLVYLNANIYPDYFEYSFLIRECEDTTLDLYLTRSQRVDGTERKDIYVNEGLSRTRTIAGTGREFSRESISAICIRLGGNECCSTGGRVDC